MILRMVVHLGRETVAVLVDEVPAETRQHLVDEVAQVEGVLAVEQARVRRSGASYFADLTLALPRRSTFEHTGELVQAATEAAHRALPRPTSSSIPCRASRGPKASLTACVRWPRATT
jgi:divalent metal cation (Fe/Co/Zn/Cd) transporter